ncbi:ATP-binding protein [Vibrio tapetis]|uniref:C4-dicarboxylate transport sensor protein DctB n=1 Tax=Vibrio tapetis subsp. tapetis TaxID=1671868 RepID=A0A2N8ZMZ0_9VIBR|nr:ATP-binding protein [Vibrio tapetis]SON53275.1 ATPase [Vibrio tapetis subsp. tapetis]
MMSNSRYHTIGTKLVLAFATSTLLLMIVSVVAWGTWNSLDRRVSSLFSSSLPSYNASFLLESRSAQIRSLTNQVSETKTKSELQANLHQVQSELNFINSTLTSLSNSSDSLSLQGNYFSLSVIIESYYRDVSQSIDLTRQLDLLKEQIQWIHQDISSELKPLRQEVQWQLQRDVHGHSFDVLLEHWNLIQTLLDDEETLIALTEDVLTAKHLSQVDNGVKVIQYKVEELLLRSKPIFSQPSAIAYQQLLNELSTLLATNGSLHKKLEQKVTLEQSITKRKTIINDSLNKLHGRIANLVKVTDTQFRLVKQDTTAMINYGNHILVVCFSLSILISLFLTYYFINRRIVRRLAALSNNIDAITYNQSEKPISIDGKDEIARLSDKLHILYDTMQEMERTNALNLINNTHACLITCNLDGHVESVNSSAKQLFGDGEFSYTGLIWEWLPAEQSTQLKCVFVNSAKLTLNGADSVTLSLGTESYPHYLRFYLRVFAHGNTSKIMITVADITEQAHANYLLEQRVMEKTHSLRLANQDLQKEVDVRRQAESHLKETQSKLIQAAKMAVVGQTMTSMAHELNQPLTSINTYLFSAKLGLELNQPDSAIHAIVQVEAMAARMSKIINNLRHFAKKPLNESPSSPISLVSVIEQAELLISTRAKRQQTAIVNIIDEDPMIYADAISIEQVLVNVLVNALDATLEVEQRTVTISNANNVDRHLIFISDTGCGFRPSVIAKLFTPFTTTKEVGLGLGLSISRSLIEKNNGSIYLASTIDKGAMVVLEFPHV